MSANRVSQLPVVRRLTGLRSSRRLLRGLILGPLLACAAVAFFAAPALAAFPGVLGQGVSSVTPFEAHLEATVNAGEEPAGETTGCHFEYGETIITEHKVPCEQGTPPGSLEGGEQGVGVTVKGLKIENALSLPDRFEKRHGRSRRHERIHDADLGSTDRGR